MIYLDNAATTKTAAEVVDAMLPFLTENYGNPGSVCSLGAKAQKAVAVARREIAALIGARQEEIYFTAGGTESDNWALKGIAEAYAEKGRHIITTKIEHHAVLRTCVYLERQGFEITYLDADSDGLVSAEAVKRAIRPDTILISVMAANNEIGTVEPIAKIGEVAKEHGVLFHTDAVQAFGQIPLHVDEMHIDLLSASGHKLNAPKGIGCLYLRNGIKIAPFMHGGAQESRRRAGTENVPGIVGFGAAASRAGRILGEKDEKMRRMRDYLIQKIEAEVPDCRLNGHRAKRLPGNVHFSFSGIDGEALLIRLDLQGICAAGGPACTLGSTEVSHVLTAIGLRETQARGAVRITLSEENTMEEMDIVAEAVKKTVADLRALSPGYERS